MNGEILDMPSKESFLDCMERGNNMCETFRETRIVTKTTALLHRIPKEVIKKLKSENQSSVDKKSSAWIYYELWTLLEQAVIISMFFYPIK